MAWYDYIVSAVTAAYAWWSGFTRWAGLQAREGWRLFAEIVLDLQNWVFTQFRVAAQWVGTFNYDLGNALSYFVTTIQALTQNQFYAAEILARSAAASFTRFVQGLAQSVTTIIQQTVQNVYQTINQTVNQITQNIYSVTGATEAWVNQRINELLLPFAKSVSDALNMYASQWQTFLAGAGEAWAAFARDPWGFISKPVTDFFMGQLEDFSRGFERGYREEEARLYGGSA